MVFGDKPVGAQQSGVPPLQAQQSAQESHLTPPIRRISDARDEALQDLGDFAPENPFSLADSAIDAEGLHQVQVVQGESGMRAAPPTLGKVSRAFLSVRAFFGNIEAREELRMHTAKTFMSARLDISRQLHEKHREAQLEANADTALSEVDQALFLEPAWLEKGFKDHRETAQQAQAAHTHERSEVGGLVKTFNLEGEGTVEGYSFNHMGYVEGSVVPTSILKGLPNERAQEKDHLMNVYVTRVAGQIVIRSGRIDTEQRANDLLAIIEQIAHENPGTHLRIVSQQLNSFEHEDKMIDDQHRWIADLNQKLAKNVQLKAYNVTAEIVHINVPSNRWYSVTRSLENRWFGSLIQAIMPKKFFKGEMLSRDQNLDSWGNYTQWVTNDARKALLDWESWPQRINQDRLLRFQGAEERLGAVEKKEVELNEFLNEIAQKLESLSNESLSNQQLDEYVTSLTAPGARYKELVTAFKRHSSEKDSRQLLIKLQSHLAGMVESLRRERDDLTFSVEDARSELGPDEIKQAAKARLESIKKLESSLEGKKEGDPPRHDLEIDLQVEGLMLGPHLQQLEELQRQEKVSLQKQADAPDLGPQRGVAQYGRCSRKDCEKLDKLFTQLSENQVKIKEKKDVVDNIILGIGSAKDQLKTKGLDKQTRAALKAQVKEGKDLLRQQRVELKRLLTEDYENFSRIEDVLRRYRDPETQAVLQKISLMRQVLGSQLGFKPQRLERGKEGMAIQLLNEKLGIVSALNCKSGLDRTGLWHAVKLGMLAVGKKIGEERQYALVNEWDKTTTIMNRISARLKKETIDEWILLNRPLAEWKEKKLLPKNMTEGEFQALKLKMQDVIALRKAVLKNLIKIGIPITTASTGVMGFKWNSGMKQNLVPLNFLPSHVKQGENGKVVPLVKYEKSGQVAEISKMGRNLLTKFQKLRGS